jgi:hypothetical protein
MKRSVGNICQDQQTSEHLSRREAIRILVKNRNRRHRMFLSKRITIDAGQEQEAIVCQE